jgi:hypothetical protein
MAITVSTLNRRGDSNREINPKRFTELCYEPRVLVQEPDAAAGMPKSPHCLIIGGEVDPSRRIVVIVVRIRGSRQQENLGVGMPCAGLLYQFRRKRALLDL